MEDGDSPGADGVKEDSAESEEVGSLVSIDEDSIKGEDGGVDCEDGGGCEDVGGGCEELGLKGILEKCISSMALRSSMNSQLYENWVNAESKLDEEDADDRRFSPSVARSGSRF